jgi:hypothetical protein
MRKFAMDYPAPVIGDRGELADRAHLLPGLAHSPGPKEWARRLLAVSTQRGRIAEAPAQGQACL